MTGIAPKSLANSLAGFALGLLLTLVPALVSIVIPPDAPGDRLFMVPALVNVLVFTALIVPVVWLFARKWSQAIVVRLFVVGIVLTAAEIGFLLAAASRPWDKVGQLLLCVELTGALAVPCVGLFSVIWYRKGRGEA